MITNCPQRAARLLITEISLDTRIPRYRCFSAAHFLSVAADICCCTHVTDYQEVVAECRVALCWILVSSTSP